MQKSSEKHEWEFFVCLVGAGFVLGLAFLKFSFMYMACLMTCTYFHTFRDTTYEYRPIRLPGRTHSGRILLPTFLHSSRSLGTEGCMQAESAHGVCVLVGRIGLTHAGKKYTFITLDTTSSESSGLK